MWSYFSLNTKPLFKQQHKTKSRRIKHHITQRTSFNITSAHIASISGDSQTIILNTLSDAWSKLRLFNIHDQFIRFYEDKAKALGYYDDGELYARSFEMRFPQIREAVRDKKTYLLSLPDLALLSLVRGYGFVLQEGDRQCDLLGELGVEEGSGKNVVLEGNRVYDAVDEVVVDNSECWMERETEREVWECVVEKFFRCEERLIVPSPARSLEGFLEEVLKDNPDLNEMVDVDMLKHEIVQCKEAMLSGTVLDNQYLNTLCKMSRSIKKVHGFYPRDHQLFVALAAYHYSQSKDTLLFQVGTGEGKSVIILLISALEHWECNNHVDIITSQSLLAEREALANVNTFKKDHFKVPVEFISREKPFTGYSKEGIWYGAPHEYECGLVEYEYSKSISGLVNKVEDARHSIGRLPSKSVALIDEVDFSFIDDVLVGTYLHLNTPGLDCLENFWRLIRDHVKKYSYLTDKAIIGNLSNILKEDNEGKYLPPFEKQIFIDHLDRFVSNAFYSFRLEENVDYVIRDDRVVIVKLSTGVSVLGNTWDMGLHQFVELKHGLKLSPFAFKGPTVTHLTLYRGYNKIIGLTGTLGDERDMRFYKDFFNAKAIRIPSFAKKQFEQMPDIVCRSTEDWLQTISIDIKTKVMERRVVLVLCENKKIAKQIEDKLREKNKELKMYICSEDDKETVHGVQEKGTVILSTNLGGRGTDIKLSEEVISQGGLHVCLSFLPSNLRIERQNIGRASRQGQPGSAVIIMKKDNQFQSSYLLREIRDQNASDSMDSLSERIRQQEHLESYYSRYVTFRNALIKRFPFIMFRYTLDQVEYKWSTYYFRIHATDNYEEQEKLFLEFKKIIETACIDKTMAYNPHLPCLKLSESQHQLIDRLREGLKDYTPPPRVLHTSDHSEEPAQVQEPPNKLKKRISSLSNSVLSIWFLILLNPFNIQGKLDQLVEYLKHIKDLF
eukprot:TRINITY_DN1721_c0_g2_i1.p1 TRINITY_DN1721_c0_g2~~TRINITY_DN1721_c0_g2_i1.p1  ORF type:complete len:953 (+),score=193.33 TRINITY_DN1721_c0_g2_i1:2-2860(+)